MTVGVVGLGLIGGSIMRALASAGVPARGFDMQASVRAVAAAHGFVVDDDAAALARASELVVVAVPPEATPDAVADALRAAPDAVVADTASVKGPVLDGVRALAPEELHRYVPAHPLAGAETAGWEAAAADVVTDAMWAACPPQHDAPLDGLCTLSRLVDQLDGRLVACTARDHDDALARTSHVPHVAAQALTRTLGEGGLRAALSGGSFRDMTRVARSDPALWVEILSMNRAGVVAALDELAEELRWYRAAIDAGDRGALERSWGDAQRTLSAVDSVRWGSGVWHAVELDPPSWEGLLALGRRGRAVRRLRVDGDVLRFEATP